MKNLILIIALAFLSFSIAYSQAEFCPDAPIECNLNSLNFTGTNSAPGTGAGGDVCNGQGAIHNAMWFGIQAGDTEMDIRVTVTNCTQPGMAPPCTNLGVQIAVWGPGCPSEGGTCVGGSADCTETGEMYTVSDLEVGAAYYVLIDGCCESVCDFDIAVDAPNWVTDFSPPSALTATLNRCSSSFDEFVFCPGVEVIFNVDDTDLQTVGADWHWSINGPGGVDWNAGAFAGSGSSFVVGDLDNGEPGFSAVGMIFEAPGIYQVCLDDIVTACDNGNGPTCQEIEIVSTDPQDFGEWDLCENSFVLDNVPFIPPNFNLNGIDFEWDGGNPIFATDLPGPNGGLIEVTAVDDCGCEFPQFIQINVVGMNPDPMVQIELYDCQLPYDFEGVEIDDIRAFNGELVVIEGGSPDTDYTGVNCDLVVELSIIEISLLDSLIEGNCGPNGIDITPDIYRADNGIFDFNNPMYEWYFPADPTNIISTSATFQAMSGIEYCVDIVGEITDFYTGDPDQCEYTQCYTIQAAGMSANPVAMPYDAVICENEVNNIALGVNQEPNVTYAWTVPASYTASGPTNQATITVSIVNYNPTDLLSLTVTGDCGSPIVIEFPIEVQILPAVTVDETGSRCAGEVLSLSFDGNTAGVANYIWDIAPASFVSSVTNGQTVEVMYPMGGNFTYTLTLVSSDNCQASTPFPITIDEELDAPQISCDLNATTTDQIVFTWPPVDGASNYAVSDIVLPPGAVGTLNGTTYTITGASPGDLATIQVFPLGSNCGTPSATESCNANTITCNPPAPTDIGNFNNTDFCAGATGNMPVQFTVTAPAGYTGTYSGNGVTATGLFDPDAAGVTIGNNTITFTYVDDADPTCSQSVTATMSVGMTPTVSLDLNVAEVCQGETFSLSGPDISDNPVYDYGTGIGDFNGLTFNNAGPATVSVTVTDASGCSNEAFVDFTVVEALEPIIISCTPSPTNVTFNWNEVANAVDYTIVFTDQNGSVTTDNQITSDTTFPVDNLMENDQVSITVTANHPNPNCSGVSDTEMCSAIACEVPDIVISATQTEFCSNEAVGAVNIDVLVNGVPAETGTGMFSGDGVTQSGDNAVFDPSAVSTGMYTTVFSYTSPVDGCVTNADLVFTVDVVEIPVLSTATVVTCVDQVVSIDHTGDPINGTASWIVSGADEISLTDDVRELSWSNAGTYPVTLTYSVPGCNPESSTVMIEVVEAASIPMISCADSGTDFILFGWNDQPQFMYEVFIDGATQGIQSESEIRVENLNEGQEVIIRVVVLDPICGDQEASIPCNATACNVVWTVDVLPDELCFGQGDAPVELMVTGFDPFDPSIIIDVEWQNAEINGNEFTPNPGSDVYSLVARYINGNCTRDTTFTVNVFDVPEFALSATDMIICAGETTTIEYDYTGPGNEMLIWDFDGTTELSAGIGTQEIAIDTDGTYTLTLQIDNNGCPSDVEEVTVIAEPELAVPMLTCGTATITSTEVTWDAVDCADEYIVYVNGSEVATQSTTSYTVEDLLSEQLVEVVIEAISICACGNSVSQPLPCISLPCPSEDFSFSRDPLDAVCIDVNAQPFVLTATPQTLPGNGTGTWTTTAFLTEDGTVNPALASVGTFTLEYNYIEGVCTFTAPTELTFIEAPSVNLMSVTDPACPDDSEGVITIEGVNGTAPYMYSLDGGQSQASGTFNTVSIGSHTVTVIDANGCESDAALVDIMAPTTPTVMITGPATVILDNDGVFDLNYNGTLDATQIDNITWTRDGVVVCDDPNCTSYIYTSATEDISLQVTVTYNGGCTIVSDVFVVDVKQIQAFYIPNTVSTQLDGVNNTWSMFIKGDEVFPQNIKVYNRWGNLVYGQEWNFDANNLPPAEVPLWDGFYGDDGPAIVSEVYVYVLSLEFEGINRITSGDITILR